MPLVLNIIIVITINAYFAAQGHLISVYTIVDVQCTYSLSEKAAKVTQEHTIVVVCFGFWMSPHLGALRTHRINTINRMKREHITLAINIFHKHITSLWSINSTMCFSFHRQWRDYDNMEFITCVTVKFTGESNKIINFYKVLFTFVQLHDQLNSVFQCVTLNFRFCADAVFLKTIRKRRV